MIVIEEVKSPSDPDPSPPKTGESIGTSPWLGLILLSMGGLLLLVRRKKIARQSD
jgi:LPXTG-motif cell wall-anchored protein